MKGSEIEDLVIVKLEEYTPFGPNNDGSGPILSGGDDLDEIKPIYSYVRQSLAQAANEVLRMIPIHKLPYVECTFGAIPDAEDNEVGYIPLPIDFLRLHTLKMKEWERPVHNVVLQGNLMYDRQYNRELRGNVCKPVAIMSGENYDSLIGFEYVDSVANGEYIISDDEDKVQGVIDDFFRNPDNKLFFFQESNGLVHKVYIDHGFRRIVDYSKSPRLEYKSVISSHIVDRFSYVQVFQYANTYESDVAECIALNCARKVCEIYGMKEQMDYFAGEINSLITNMNM